MLVVDQPVAVQEISVIVSPKSISRSLLQVSTTDDPTSYKLKLMYELVPPTIVGTKFPSQTDRENNHDRENNLILRKLEVNM